jgi:hypothetical protein
MSAGQATNGLAGPHAVGADQKRLKQPLTIDTKINACGFGMERVPCIRARSGVHGRLVARPALAAAGLFLAAALTACSSSLETPESMMPTGKYNFYNCEQLATQARETGNREQELRAAMTKASGGPGGEFVNALAYRAEFLSVQGDLKEIEIAAQSKNCKQRMRAISDGAVR